MAIIILLIFTALLSSTNLSTTSINMDSRSLEEQCAALKLVEEETGGLAAPEMPVLPDSEIHHNLVGRFLTDRQIKAEHMQPVLASVWRPVMGMFAVTLADDLFLFQFPHPRDMQRVIDDGPWSFDNQLLVCEQVPLGIRPEDVTLNSVSFWVQLHGLPAMYASSEFIQKIGDYIGSFIALDPLNFGGNWRSFYRIRVRLDVLNPLKRRMKLLRRDGETQWITFRYEKLGTFCYCCGHLGHSDKFCKIAYEQGILPDAFPFGAWLRAGPRRQVKPVGARWLLSTAANPVASNATNEFGVSPGALLAMEENLAVHGDLKRRREDGGPGDGMNAEDVKMTETSRISEKAGLVDQARPEQ
ncbi:PREDICTED: uncharacterized protein LOC109173521 [Ipomoea nil]|uniref:uncharacterized protein LOC109173521 n=1 Tax=Ipomoea nil TaxID=35883 RepID=UPI000900D37E|nr:PREDICTED: uncharacterized protein LOC109173521 [Ipomoea nil]